MNELVAWLTDPATWQGETGIPVRLLEHVAISSISVVAAGASACSCCDSKRTAKSPYPADSSCDTGTNRSAAELMQ